MIRSVQKSQLLKEQTEEFVSHLFDAGHLTEAKRLAVTLKRSANTTASTDTSDD
jgi:hypothetical protein